MLYHDFIRNPINNFYFIKHDISGRLLYTAIKSNQYNFVKFLISNGSNVNITFNFQDCLYESPLQLAIYMKHWAIVKLLHDNNAVLNAFNSDFLIDDNFEVFEFLCNEKNINNKISDVSSKMNMYPLTFAILNKAEKIVNYLITHQAHVQNRDILNAMEYNICPLIILKYGLLKKIQPYMLLSTATKYKQLDIIKFVFENDDMFFLQGPDLDLALMIAGVNVKTRTIFYYPIILEHLTEFCLQT